MPEKGPSQEVEQVVVHNNPLAMIVTNPNLEDNPIVYVNRAFERLTGYSMVASIGRNCRFLQGEGTDRETVDAMRDAIEARREVEVDIVNYRADGVEFLNKLLITPIYNEDKDLAYFLGIQRQISGARRPTNIDEELREIQHRVKNHLQMVVSMIRMQSRTQSEGANSEFSTLANRVETLQLLYQEMTESGVATVRSTQVQLGAYVTRIVSAISSLSNRPGVRVNVDTDAFEVSVDLAARIGLIASEIYTNALQHAFEDRSSGLVEIYLKQLSGGVIRLRVGDDGVGMPRDASWPDGNSLGGRIVSSLTENIGAQLSVDSGRSRGTTITVDIPFQGEISEGAN